MPDEIPNEKKYKWDSPLEWLEWARNHSNITENDLWELIRENVDGDMIQNMFQSDMEEDGYFKEVDDDGEFIEEDDDEVEVLACEVCQGDADEDDSTSTYCGTVHYKCLFQHMKECEVCGKDDGLRSDLSEAQRQKLDKIWKEED